MHNRNLRGSCRGGNGTRSRRNRRPGPGRMIALGVAIPVLVVGYFLAAQGPEHAVSSADVQGPIPATTAPATTALARASGASSVGGWGRGGYPMVTGPASEVGSNGEAGNAPDGGTANVTDVASENWAGYAATGTAGSLTSVSSSWAPAGRHLRRDRYLLLVLGGARRGRHPDGRADRHGGRLRRRSRVLPGLVRDFPERPGVLLQPRATGRCHVGFRRVRRRRRLRLDSDRQHAGLDPDHPAG